jgi:hypothetical protein
MTTKYGQLERPATVDDMAGDGISRPAEEAGR